MNIVDRPRGTYRTTIILIAGMMFGGELSAAIPPAPPRQKPLDMHKIPDSQNPFSETSKASNRRRSEDISRATAAMASRKPPPTMISMKAVMSKNERVANLRRHAASQLEELHRLGFQMSFEGLTTILAWEGDSTADEDMMREAREIAEDYSRTVVAIEDLTGEKRASRVELRKRMDERIRQLTIHSEGNYTVHLSGETSPYHYSFPDQPPKSDASHNSSAGTHTERYLAIEKVPVKAGFKNGAAYYKLDWDVVWKTRIVPNNK